MVVVHHRRDAVKAVAVKLVLVHPPARVGQQETHRLPVAIVEQPRVPHPVVAALAAVEVHRVGAIKHVDAVDRVLRRMRVHDVHEHDKAEPMRLVNERLELLGSAAARGSCKEVGHVVAERAVVRVLLDCHDLDGVVAELADARQHVPAELKVRVDLGLGARHADVALVDAHAPRLGRAWVLERVRLVGVDLARRANFLGLPVDAVELDLVPLLCGPLDPCGDALHPRARRRLDARLDLGPVRDLRPAVDVGKEELKRPERVLMRPVRVLWVPVVELADQRQRLCPGRPLAVPRADLALVLATVEAVLQVALRKLVEPSLVVQHRLADILEHLPAVLEVRLLAPQRIVPAEAVGAVMVGDGADRAILVLVGHALGHRDGRHPVVLWRIARNGGGPARRRVAQRLAQQLVLLPQHLQRRRAVADLAAWRRQAAGVAACGRGARDDGEASMAQLLRLQRSRSADADAARRAGAGVQPHGEGRAGTGEGRGAARLTARLATRL
mmetsp:Transcript_38602/g.114640  ORF Transcript_38602/g.114640 Transcript_38602/m.114640 type:complete len:500 (+) Transcript_38602:1140-2639(+)